jgi:hypothetical protein
MGGDKNERMAKAMPGSKMSDHPGMWGNKLEMLVCQAKLWHMKFNSYSKLLINKCNPVQFYVLSIRDTTPAPSSLRTMSDCFT